MSPSPKRPVTPEVAGSSPVAPVRSLGNRHALLSLEAQTNACYLRSGGDPAGLVLVGLLASRRIDIRHPFRARRAPEEQLGCMPRERRSRLGGACVHGRA